MNESNLRVTAFECMFLWGKGIIIVAYIPLRTSMINDNINAVVEISM